MPVVTIVEVCSPLRRTNGVQKIYKGGSPGACQARRLPYGPPGGNRRGLQPTLSAWLTTASVTRDLETPVKGVCPPLHRYRGVDGSLQVGSPCIDQERCPLSRMFGEAGRGLRIARSASLVADAYPKFGGLESASQYSEPVTSYQLCEPSRIGTTFGIVCIALTTVCSSRQGTQHNGVDPGRLSDSDKRLAVSVILPTLFRSGHATGHHEQDVEQSGKAFAHAREHYYQRWMDFLVNAVKRLS